MSTVDDSVRRANNRAVFLKLLGHLGRKEFEAFEACLHPEFVQVWPYRPIPNMPDRIEGAHALRQLFETGMADFDPYSYEVLQIHEMLDPDALIAEYTSHSFYHPRKVTYENRYLSIMRFRDGKLAFWSEYVNPLIIKETLMDDFEKSPEERVGALGKR